jgi:hypothetical protein
LATPPSFPFVLVFVLVFPRGFAFFFALGLQRVLLLDVFPEVEAAAPTEEEEEEHEEEDEDLHFPLEPLTMPPRDDGAI